MASQVAQNGSIVDLTSFSYTVQQAGPYFFQGILSLPTIVNGGGPSSCVVSATQNGSGCYTGQTGAEGFLFYLLCAVGDVIVITLSSAAAADQPINAIKATISLGLGVT